MNLGSMKISFGRSKDSCVTAPLISWPLILSFMGFMAILIAVQAVIVDALENNIGLMVIVLMSYLVFVCLILAGIIWLVWRQVIGIRLREIARSAQKVAA